jgi:hypothetical protein
MARSYRFAVTEEDIARGKIGDSFNCMVAEAIKRQHKGARHVEADLQTVRFSDKDGRHVFLTPHPVAQYIVRFDAGIVPEPFNFQLRLAVPALQRSVVTPGAKAVKAAENKVNRAEVTRRNAAAVIADPESSDAEVALAEKRIAAAEVAIQEGRQERAKLTEELRAKGERVTAQRVSTATRRAAPRVHKTSEREFGARLLRVNQQDGRTHTVSRDF